MAAEPWALKMGKTKVLRNPLKDGDGAASSIGILSFEVANAMSRAIHLYRSLSDGEVSRLRHRILSSPALRSVVSPHDSHLHALALAEKLDDLHRVAAVASRLGSRCTLPALQGFEHIYSDLLIGRLDPTALGFLPSDIGRTFPKMERLVASTAALYAALESLAELEDSAKKVPPNADIRRALDQRIHWVRHKVEHLRSTSLWNQRFDKAVLLLVWAVCAIHPRILFVFGNSITDLENLPFNENRQLSQFRSGSRLLKSGMTQKTSPLLHCISNPLNLFTECITHDEDDSLTIVLPTGELGNDINRRTGGKTPLTKLAPSSTLGGSSLALHYANIVTVVEKLLRYPRLAGGEAKNDLYRMLPESLRKSLKSCVKETAIRDAPLDRAWREAVYGTLRWLSPMAHDTVRWHAERSFDRRGIVPMGRVLLLQTLHFADRAKVEAAICQLLVGLSRICRDDCQDDQQLIES
ncbi:hypothetical protein HPP92_022322 [Vanilla planifolia]|uniref:DUF668 domain-containing protein n=1 Tax=Vanilla planifolia TaxID=51239 RepID=A0A835PX45_VANPL|nr:hypothetical protein HPP92_022322 [Vanilla planifolia]